MPCTYSQLFAASSAWRYFLLSVSAAEVGCLTSPSQCAYFLAETFQWFSAQSGEELGSQTFVSRVD
jgi:hypothetical protein